MKTPLRLARLALVAFVVSFASLAAATDAEAALPVFEGDRSTASVLGLTRLGYRVIEQGGEVSGQGYVRMARIGTVVEYEGLGSAVVVAEFAAPNPLLDAFAELTVLDPLVFRGGQNKAPLSLELDTSATQLPFVDRTAYLGRIAPNRLVGGEMELTLGDEAFSVEARVGLWNPEPLPLREDGYAGQYIIPKVGINIGGFGQIHFAYLEHVFAENPTIPAERPAPYDRQVSFGVWFEPSKKVRVLGEGLVAFEGPFGDPAYGAHIEGLYRLGDFENGIAYAPALAYDYVDDIEPGEEHTVRAGLNVHLRQFAVVVGFYYGGLYNSDLDEVTNTGEAHLQLDF